MATKTQRKEFIEKIAPLIQQNARERGYKLCSAMIAQACTESKYGLSGLAKYHNYFGLKCGSKWTGKSVNMSTKEEYTPGTLTTIKDNFRAYDSLEAGVKGYFDFISTSRYANLKGATSAQEYLTLIKQDGFATAHDYVAVNMSVIRSLNLDLWDDFGATQPKQEIGLKDIVEFYPEPQRVVKKGYTGDDVKWVQDALNRKGYSLAVDGIFGSKTLQAVEDFQKKSNIIHDGKVGPMTVLMLKS